jgi:SAM-dependent methyltransferase
MTTARELYELWAAGSPLEAVLDESLAPRGPDSLFELFASLGPRPGQLLVDVGARDGRHLRRLVEEHGLRGIGVDPVPRDPDVVEGSIEALPLDDASADWIWCRDVLCHVDVDRGLGECARVLRPGGTMVAYVTLATELLEPRERDMLAGALGLTTLEAETITGAADEAGLRLTDTVSIGGEWRERMIEDGDWNPADALLRISRLHRRGDSGPEAEAVAADQLWGVYQLIGKLNPTVFVWTRDV